MEYNRQKAVEYAHRWAYGRNPCYYDFTKIGGDCTNFASQCVFAGAGVMNYTPTFGWFYISADNRTPSWTGVEYFYNFMTRRAGPGPYMKVVSLSAIQPGDVIQLRFPGESIFAHTPVVVKTGTRPAPDNILMAAHTFDTDYRPLSTFVFAEMRPLHVDGVRT